MVNVARIYKAMAAVAGALGVIASQGLLTGTAQHWVTVAAATISAALVYLVPNQPAAIIPPPT